MDKKAVLGWILIAIAFFAWLMYSSVNEKPAPRKETTQNQQESEKAAPKEEANPAPQANDSLENVNKYGRFFASVPKGETKEVIVETPLYKAVISSKGAAITKWTLKKYTTWNEKPTQLIADEKGELYLTFISIDGRKIDSRDFNWQFDKESVNLSGASQKESLTAKLNLGEGKFIKRTFTFNSSTYTFSDDIYFNNLQDVVPNRGFNYIWSEGLRYQEKNSVDESAEAHALTVIAGDAEEINADEDKEVETSVTGAIDYAGVKTKFFGAVMQANPGNTFDGTVDMYGKKRHVRNGGVLEEYTVSYRIPYRSGSERVTFKNYIGPLDYDLLKAHGYTKMVNFGWKFIRPIGEYFIKPILMFAYNLVSSWGIALILLALIMKIILYPLSIKQMKSAQKMKLLAPEMAKIREKYKDDQPKQQQETMKLYSSYGINPMGGCLPLVLQMPILYALWTLLRASVELRHAEFLWIKDLSAPEYIVHFGTSFLGMSGISSLALLMAITMFIQQKMSIQDPRQKAMLYMMPVMFLFLFSSFPAGLNLYYFMFNIFSIAHQYYINNFSRSKLSLEEMKKNPAKEGWLQKKMREAQEIAAQQQNARSGGSQQQNRGGQGGRSGNQRPNQGGRKR